MKRKQWIFLSIVFIIVWIFYSIFLKNIPQILKVVANITISADKEYIIDSLSSTLTIIAVILTSKRYFEQWHFWIVLSAMGVLLFIVSMLRTNHLDLDSLSALVMWSEYLISLVYGFILWKKLNNPSEELNSNVV